MKKLLAFILSFLLILSTCGVVTFATTESVAKVGDTEYATIDEAIAAWSDGTTLTLLADVTLSDVIKLSSTEYHILDLGTYTMTAASGKDAIQYVVNGRSSASYALDIKADATNPGGITATGKTIVSHLMPTSNAPSKDRPITRFYGGVFNASYVVKQGGTSSWGFLTSGYTGASAPYFQFYGGVFNGTIYTNRSQNQFHGGTFNGSMQMSVDSSAYTLIAGGTFKNLSNSMGSSLNSDKFVIGTAKGANNGSVCVDENGYYVITTTTPANAEASVASNYNSNNYFYYSTVNTDGMYYEDVYMALEKNPTATVTVYEEKLDLEGIDFTGTIVVPEGQTLTITNAPADLKVEGEGEVIIAQPVAKVGDTNYNSLQEAIDEANAGDTVTLLSDIALTDGIVIATDDKIVLELNGYVISRNTEVTSSTAAITNNGDLTIQDTIGDGKITAYAANPDTAGIPYYANNTITNCGVLTIKSGTIENSTGDEARAAYPVDNNSTLRDAILNIEGGELSGRGAIRQFANSTTHKNEVNITGGKVSGTSYALWMQNPGSGDPVASLTVSGGEVAKILLSPSANFEPAITDGTISEVAIWAASGNAERDPSGFVSGGTFYTAVDAVFCAEGFIPVDNGDGTYGVKEGTFVAYVGEKGYETLAEAVAAAHAGDTIKIMAGTYAVPTMKAGVTYEGVGEVLFEGTLSGTLEDITLKNLHIKGSNAQRWAYAKGDLVFENVTFEATGVYALHFDGITEGATLLYKDCTIIGWAAMSGSPASCVFDGCTIKGNGSYGLIRTYFDATIENCTFDVANVNPDDVYQDGIHAVDATVTVNNCTNVNGDMKDIIDTSRVGYIILDGETIHFHKWEEGETVAPDFGVEGYTLFTCPCGAEEKRNIQTAKIAVAQIGETKYETLAEAVAAAQNGDTITLLTDVVLSDALTISSGLTVTIDLNGYTITGTDTTEKNFGLIQNNGTLTINDSVGTGAIKLSATVNSGWNRYSAVISNNPGGTLVVNGGTLEHLGGTDMAYGIDSLTNGTIGDVSVTINGGKITSPYRAIRQFLNSDSKQNVLTINGGIIESSENGTAVFF